MGILLDFVEKHGGVYKEEGESSTHTTVGKLTSNQMLGRVEIEGKKITFQIDEVGGATQTSEPFRMLLYFDEPLNKELLIYPKSKFAQIFKKKAKIVSQYKFEGNKKAITKIKLSDEIMSLLDGEDICVNLKKNASNRMSITPFRGYRDVAHLEKMSKILILIGKELLDNKTNN